MTAVKEKKLLDGLKTINIKEDMHVNGVIKSIEIWIPLDAKDENSRVLTLSLSSTIKMKQVSETIIQTNNLTGMIVRNEMVKKLADTKILINDLEIVMHNRHLENIEGEQNEESLLMPSSITIIHDQLAIPPQLYDATNIAIQIEPLELRVGFREVDNFKDIAKVFQDILSKLDGENEDLSKMSYERLEAKRLDQKSRIEKAETKLKEVLEKKRMSYFQKNQIKEIRLMNMKISLSLLSLSLMDDTDMHEFPIINISIND